MEIWPKVVRLMRRMGMQKGVIPICCPESMASVKKSFAIAVLALSALFIVPHVSADPIEDIFAGVTARKHGDYDEAIRLYSRALESGSLSQSNRAVTLSNRCNVYNDKGQYDRAISDCNEAIALNPDSALPFNNRGNSFMHKGQYDRAIQDYNAAININPDFARAFSNRGLVYYYKGMYSRAEMEFGKSVDLDPRYPYAALRLYVTKQRLGTGGVAQLTEQAARLDLEQWPGPLVRLYLDKLTPAEALVAVKHGDRRREDEQRCEAAFYVAEYHLGKGNRNAGLTQLRVAEEACRPFPGFVEHHGTKAELKRLSERK